VLPLSLILLAKQGDKTGTAPKLVFSRFYNCSHEVKFGREKHKLQLIARQEVEGKSETVSLPIPLESITGVAAIPGVNDYEKLLIAYDDRASLRSSIEHMVEVMEKKEAVFLEKSAELESMSEVEEEEEVEETEDGESQEEEDVKDDDELEKESDLENQEEESEHTEVDAKKEENEDPEDDAQEKESKDVEVEENESLKESDVEKDERESDVDEDAQKEDDEAEKEDEEAQEEDEEAEEEDEESEEVDEEAEEEDEEAKKKAEAAKLEEEQKKAEEAKKKAEAAKLEKQKKAEAAKLEKLKKAEAAKLKKQKKAEMEKQRKKEKKQREMKRQKRALFEARVEKLKTNFEKAKKNLAEERTKLGELEKEFGKQLSYLESDSAEGAEMFFLELKEGQKVVEDAGDKVEEPGSALEEESSSEPEGVKEEDAENVEKTDVVDLTKSSCCVEALAAGEKFCSGCGVATSTIKSETTEKTTEKVVEEEKHEKITESPVHLFFTLKEPLVKYYASNVETMLCDKSSLEEVSMIIIGYNPNQSSAEHLKDMNEAMEGPWKDIRKKPDQLINESPFTLGKTLTYLAKMFKRQDISDNTLDICELCEGEIKRMAMEKHVNEQCQMRDESCQFCDTIFIFKDLKEHHGTDCPLYPIHCPQKCSSAKIARSKIEDHFKTCPNSIVCCEFKYLGCDVDLKRRQIPVHMKNEAVEHVRLLHRQLTTVSNYLLSQDAALGDVFNPVPPAEVIEEDPVPPAEVIEEE